MSRNRLIDVCLSCGHWFSWLVIGIVTIVVAGLLSLQFGLLDRVVSDYAQSSFQRIVGNNSAAKVERTVLRFTGDGYLAFEARDLNLSQSLNIHNPQDQLAAIAAGVPVNPQFEMNVSKAQLKLDPIDLAQGEANISAVEISDVDLVFHTPKLTDETPALAMPQIDRIEQSVDGLFAVLAQLEDQKALQNAEKVTFNNVRIDHRILNGFGGLTLLEVDVEKRDGTILALSGTLMLGEQTLDLNIDQSLEGDRKWVNLQLSRIAIDFETKDPDPKFRSGLKTKVSSILEIGQSTAQERASVTANFKFDPGTLKMGGEETELNASEINVAYDPNKKSIELLSSQISVAKSQFPLVGGIINAENFEGGPDSGLVFDLIINDGRLAPKDTDEEPVAFSAKAFGHYDFSSNILVAEELLVTTGSDYAAGNAKFRFVDGQSPEINLSLDVPRIRTAVAKQFWPYWLGRGTRGWATNSIYGGELNNLKLWLHVDAGRFSNPIRPIRHKPEDYQVDYTFKNARVNIVGEIPPVRNAFGNMRLRGEEITVNIESGASYFPSNRKMDITSGSVVIPNTNNVPLMANIDLNLSGWADAAAELISFEPIDALDEVGLLPDEISGLVDANVKASFGLIQNQNPPEPVWDVRLALNGVDIKKPIEGYILTNINGTMDVDLEKAVLDAKMKADGVNVTANIVEAVGNSGVEQTRVLTGTINDKERAILKLGLDDIVFGDVDFEITQIAENVDDVQLKLRNSKIVSPGTGWVKSKGVAADASFQLVTQGDNIEIEDFKFGGKGFSARGNISLDGDGMKSAKFTSVKLAPKDNYNFDLTRIRGGYKVSVAGEAFDMRPLITQIKANSEQVRKQSKSEASFDLSGKINKVYGFGGEHLTNATMRYVEEEAIPRLAEFTGRTKAGGSVAARLKGDAKDEQINVASDDSGSFWRFFDIYAYVQGGALDLVMTKTGNEPYKGDVLIRKFKVIGDERLKTLVSTRASEKERSLNEALKGRLDVSRVSFDLADIRVQMDNGVMFVDDGIVRGAQIGAAFSGLLYDQDDNTDMAGTFMPAYALNRFFGEIPVLGALLGNGKDKALLGITFRVSGNADNPRVQVNPLSVVAPGVFRNIFEFRR
ncbi:MAG: hypothetical protein JJ858_17870 [Rhizobiaceae bacterium]|nr:hypothetical protein [Rhizobiaceae bacterium]